MPPKGYQNGEDSKGVLDQDEATRIDFTTTSRGSSNLDFNSFPYTFNQIIEADHLSISRIASRAVRPTISPSARLSYTTNLLWRLIRHDISEELVMRPAFKRHLGDQGIVFATQDTKDHTNLKHRLLVLFENTLAKPLHEVDFEDVVAQIKPLASEMAEHMREESGIWLPKLEACIGQAVSFDLGRRYATTLVLTPGLQLSTDIAATDLCQNEGDRILRFSNVLHYAKTDIGEFIRILAQLEERAEKSLDDGYLDRRVREELVDMGLNLRSDVDANGSKRTRVGETGRSDKL